MKWFTKDVVDFIKSQLVLGVVKEHKGNKMLIEDQDGDSHEVLIGGDLIKKVVVNLQGIKIIYGYHYEEVYHCRGCRSFKTKLELVHLIDGPNAGQTLFHSHESDK